jgi:hypothetical protein
MKFLVAGAGAIGAYVGAVPASARPGKNTNGSKSPIITSHPNVRIMDGELCFGVESFLLRSRRGSVVRGALHLPFCVCWVFQGRIT